MAAGWNHSGRRWRPPLPFWRFAPPPPVPGESVFDKGGLRADAGIGPCKLPQIFPPTNRKAHLWIPQAN